ncbi:hypothetical protein [uncultured Methylobacterium sp.]|uniref:hypothetical protein n=1 Tax=uncultured Methylobacterium sp. TaxID=157278 RepID=UPI0035CB6F00
MPSPLPRLAALAALLLVGLAGAALAQGMPRSVGECERLKNDLAYNQCLAMFGPTAKNVAGGYATGEASSAPALPPTAVALPQAEAPAEEAHGGRRGRYRVRRGRQSAVFTAGSGEVRAYRHRRRR